MTNEAYKPFGLLSVVLILVVATFMVHKWRGDSSMSLSLHAASDKKAYLLFGATLSICGVLFYLFELNWLDPHFRLSAAFKFVAAAGLVLQLLTAWIPDANKIERRIHRFSAYSMSAAMTVLAAFLALSSNVLIFPRILAGFVVLMMISIWYIYPFVKKLRPYYLFYQAAYILGFFLAVLTATYIN